MIQEIKGLVKSPDVLELLEIVGNRGRADIQAIEQFGETRNIFQQKRDGPGGAPHCAANKEYRDSYRGAMIAEREKRIDVYILATTCCLSSVSAGRLRR